MKQLMIGCGYLGKRVAKHWKQAGKEVHVWTRSESHAELFNVLGYQSKICDITDPSSFPEQESYDSIVFSVGYDRKAEKTKREVYIDGLKNTLDWLSNPIRRFVYVSSTGVYGQTDGSWVTEESLCDPQSEGGKICLEAEKILFGHPYLRDCVTVLRMSGLYGPNRIPNSQRLLLGEPISVPTEGFLNLIHVEDAAQAVAAAVDSTTMGSQLFCVSDGNPVIRRDYYEYVAELLDAPKPSFSKPDESSHVAQRSLSNKRVSNQKVVGKLDLNLQFPDYKTGLREIILG